MDLSEYTRALRNDLISAAAVGDETTRQSATVLAAAIEPAARLAIMNALSDFAAEVTGQLDGITVEVRLEGRDIRIAVDQQQTPAAEDAPFVHAKLGNNEHHPDGEPFGRAIADASGELSRTTVRIFNDLKSQAESAAASRGESLNAFISRAIAESVRGPKGENGFRKHKGPRRPGSSLEGFVQG